MSFFVRGIARGKLREKNPVHRRVRAGVRGDEVVVVYDGDRFETPRGRWRPVSAGGERVQLRQEVRAGRIHQTFRTPDGEKRIVLGVSEDGRRLELEVELVSPRLPAPLRYRLTYRRAE
jgi:hypothetical protein